jgi:predicted lipoprotein with Yx(FWY)xxD motif
MSILHINTSLRPLAIGAILGSVWLGACSSDAPGIAKGKAGASAVNSEEVGGEGNVGGTEAPTPTTAGTSAEGGSAGSMPTTSAGGEPPVTSGGTSSSGGSGGTETDPLPATGGEPPLGEAGEGGSGGAPIVEPVECVFHTTAPPPSGTGGDAAGAATVVVQTSPFVGAYLTDATGRTLYTYGADVPGDCNAPPVSNCTADCPTTWPVFDAGGRVLGPGLDDANFGTMTRPDGSPQTTYFGWPLYYYKSDLTLGQMTGQGKGKTWHAAQVTPPAVVIMKAGTTKYLADTAGHTLYVSAADQAGTGSEDPVSNCTQDCLTTFAPFHLKTFTAVTSLSANDFQVFVRKGQGGLQLAFKGQPLYRALTDVAPGTTNGTQVAGFTSAIVP